MSVAAALLFIFGASPPVGQALPIDDATCPAVHAKDPASLERSLVFEVPDTVAEVDVPGHLEALGAPVRLLAFKSTQSIPQLQTYFQATFEKAGLFVPPPQLVADPGWPQVTGYDPETRISYTALFQPNRDGTSTVILGKAHLAERRAQPAGSAFAPVYPGGLDLVTSNLEGAQLLAYSARAQPEAVAGFYREVLSRSGYRAAGPGIFQGPEDLLRIELSKNGDDTRVLVFRQAAGTRSGAAWQPESEDAP